MGRMNGTTAAVFFIMPLVRHKIAQIKGEMSEWLKEHAWKALRWSSVETYRITFSAVVSTT